jgi:hypothetical protein
MGVSCKKTTHVTKAFSLPGTWRVYSEVGGIAGLHETFPVNQGHITYIFRTDNTCTRISYTDTTNSTYTIVLNTPAKYDFDQYTISLSSEGSLSNMHDTLWTNLNPNISDDMAYGFLKD